jgi:cobalamin biosynthesis protein CbiG
MIRRLQLRDQPTGENVAETRTAWKALAEPLALVAVRSLAALVWSTVESALHRSGHRDVIHGC